jgi:hypothetical protein
VLSLSLSFSPLRFTLSFLHSPFSHSLAHTRASFAFYFFAASKRPNTNNLDRVRACRFKYKIAALR